MQRQTVLINFQSGLDTKSDPWQLPIGKFLTLQNTIFTTGGLLQKRNGYAALAGVAPTSTYLTTLNGNLISVGNTVNAYSPSINNWVVKGNLAPCSLSVLPLIRNNLNQIQTDSVTANGMTLTVFTEVGITFNTATLSYNTYRFAIADSVTGQNITPPSFGMPVLVGGNINGSSRVTVVGNYFVVVSPVLISSSTFLQYFSIPITNPLGVNGSVNVSRAQNIFSEVYIPITNNLGWDLTVTNNTLVVAYNSTAGGQGIHVVSLLESQIASNLSASFVHTFTNAAYKGAIVSICTDLTTNPNVVYISFWNNTTTNGYTAAVTIGFGVITDQFTPVQTITTTAISNLASAAQNASCKLFYEVTNAYSYDSAIPSNYINFTSISAAGSITGTGNSIRSVGLASKGFIVSGVIYILTAYQSAFQNTYFLINGSTSRASSPVIVAKLAYENGGGYLNLGLPIVTVSGNSANVSYLFKDNVQALNTIATTNQTSTGGIYSQTGINEVSFTLGTEVVDTAEIAHGLHISGGYLGFFDGYIPVEHNFFLFPDSIEATFNASSTVTPTGTFLIGSTTITLSSLTGVFAGMSITDTSNAAYIPNGTQIISVNSFNNTVTINKATTHAGTSDNLSIQGNIAAVPLGGTAGVGAYYYQVTYEWTDNNGLPYYSSPSIAIPVTTSGSSSAATITINVPTLRLTQKINNPVKIVIYRWSTNTQAYNQVTSITQPVLNDTTIDSITFVDTLPDNNLTTSTEAGIPGVAGNNLIYTTGGVVPDTNGPSSNIMTLFDTRLWVVDSEDSNLLWVSKQVIEGTPVEMSQFFTIYVAPNIGTTASTGAITAIFPMDDKLIIFKRNSIFYLNGVGPNNLGTTSVGCSLGNYTQPTFITAVVGCTNEASIVLTQDGLMFQSDKGIWILGRNLQTSYIGAPVETFNSYLVTSSNVIPETNFVLFTLNDGPMLMYDFYYGQWGTFVGVEGASSTIYNGLHTILTRYGQIFQETPGAYLDNSSPVLMSFTTSWLNLASLQGYERFYEFYILAKYLTPHFLQVQVAYNYNSSIVHEAIIKPINFSAVLPSPFGVPTPFGSVGDKEQWRVHSKQQLTESFQLTINEIYDPSMGIVAGAGFTMSGLSCVIGIKSATRPIPGGTSIGLG